MTMSLFFDTLVAVEATMMVLASPHETDVFYLESVLTLAPRKQLLEDG